MYWLQSAEKKIHISGLYSFIYYEHDNTYYFPGEDHNFWEMVYVEKGEISVVVGKNVYTLNQGQLIFHKPNEFHAHSSTAKEGHHIVVTSFETTSAAMQFFENKAFTLNDTHKSILNLYINEIKNAFSQTYAVNKNVTKTPISDPLSFQLVLSHLEHFLIELLRDNNVNVRNMSDAKLARKNMEAALIDSIKAYLRNNICNNLSLDDICSHFHLSRTYLYETFHNGTKQSVIDYYIDLKISKAKQLLQKRELNITQIAETLGYTSIHHFSRSFKSRTGMSPSDYVKK
jgi:AraC-like DNA-binding protein